jgi:hypothetical protein
MEGESFLTLTDRLAIESGFDRQALFFVAAQHPCKVLDLPLARAVALGISSQFDLFAQLRALRQLAERRGGNLCQALG